MNHEHSARATQLARIRVGEGPVHRLPERVRLLAWIGSVSARPFCRGIRRWRLFGFERLWVPQRGANDQRGAQSGAIDCGSRPKAQPRTGDGASIVVDSGTEEPEDSVTVRGDVRGRLKVDSPSGNEHRRTQDLRLVAGRDGRDVKKVKKPPGRHRRRQDGEHDQRHGPFKRSESSGGIGGARIQIRTRALDLPVRGSTRSSGKRSARLRSRRRRSAARRSRPPESPLRKG